MNRQDDTAQQITVRINVGSIDSIHISPMALGVESQQIRATLERNNYTVISIYTGTRGGVPLRLSRTFPKPCIQIRILLLHWPDWQHLLLHIS